MENKTNVKDCFKIRFATLRAESGLSQSKLGKLLSLSPATIGYYENGDRLPDIETAARIANYFGVSADYLLGLSDVRSTEQDMKIACEVTGLSEKAIENIASINHNPKLSVVLEQIFTDSLFSALVGGLQNTAQRIINSMKFIDEIKIVQQENEKELQRLIDIDESLEYEFSLKEQLNISSTATAVSNEEEYIRFIEWQLNNYTKQFWDDIIKKLVNKPEVTHGKHNQTEE